MAITTSSSSILLAMPPNSIPPKPTYQCHSTTITYWDDVNTLTFNDRGFVFIICIWFIHDIKKQMQTDLQLFKEKNPYKATNFYPSQVIIPMWLHHAITLRWYQYFCPPYRRIQGNMPWSLDQTNHWKTRCCSGSVYTHEELCGGWWEDIECFVIGIKSEPPMMQTSIISSFQVLQLSLTSKPPKIKCWKL